MITLAEAKYQSRIDSDAEDAEITNDILAAEAAILQYVGDGAYKDNDAAGGVFREDVRTACKILCAIFYRYRTGELPEKVEAGYGYGYLPLAVTMLLFPYRRLVSV